MKMRYTRRQFLNTTEPYDYLYGIRNDPFRHAKELEIIKSNAREEGITNFQKIYQCYVRSKDSLDRPDTPIGSRQIPSR